MVERFESIIESLNNKKKKNFLFLMENLIIMKIILL